jgi:hypothetical protein
VHTLATAALGAWGVLLAAGRAGAEPPSALHWSATIYAANAAVALKADRRCRGQRCSERYFSLVPVLGGLAQLSHGGLRFHDDHHGPLCAPLTVAAVGGQLAGIAAQLAGLPLELRTRAGGRLQLSIVPYQDGTSSAGLGLAWIQ